MEVTSEIKAATENPIDTNAEYISQKGIHDQPPIVITKNSDLAKIKLKNIYEENMHKPCLGQYAAFLV